MTDTGMAAFARWRELVAPPAPEVRLGPATVDWTAVETDVGLRLPSDYKAYIDTYGMGYVGGLVVVLHPTTHAQPLNLVHSAREQDSPEMYEGVETPPPHPLGIGPGRLFACAFTETQECVYWYVNGADPDRWPIVFRDEEGYDWQEHELSLVGFLLGFFNRQLRPDRWIEAGYLRDPVTFTPNPFRHPMDV